MGKTLTVDEDRVLAAAEKCDTFKGVAKELWPDAFRPKEPEWEDVTDDVGTRWSRYGSFFALLFTHLGSDVGYLWPGGGFHVYDGLTELYRIVGDKSNIYPCIRIERRRT